MDISQQRRALAEYYGVNSAFAQRMKTMRDSQVTAIYLRLKGKGILK